MIRTGFILIFFILITCFKTSAQVKTLGAPSPAEKKEVIALMKSYENLLQVMSGTNENLRKKVSGDFAKGSLGHLNVQVYNDLDSMAKPEDNVRIFAYTMQLPKTYASKDVQIKLEKVKFNPVKFDQLRRYHFIEVEASKVVEWMEIKDTMVEVAREDSIPILDMLSSAEPQPEFIKRQDTIRHALTTPQVFHIKFEKFPNGEIRAFQILGVTHPKGQPVLEPIHATQQWWVDLDPEWKAFIKKQWKLEDEYPRVYEIDNVLGTRDISLKNIPASNSEPLGKFRNVEKLDISGSNIQDLGFLKSMSRIKVLDITKTAITSLKGIEHLEALEELYCSGLKLTDLSPLKNLTNLVELDCSENELESIAPLANLVNLKKLNISLNYSIKNVDEVKNLVNLEKLAMRKLEIKTLEPVKGLPNLVYLDCYNSGITTLEPIRNLTKLMHLDCSHNALTSLEPIKNYKYITNLYIAGTNIADISDIKNYVYLRELICNNTPLTSLGPVHKMEDLLVLKCFYTRIDKNEIQRFKKNHPRCQITYY